MQPHADMKLAPCKTCALKVYVEEVRLVQADASVEQDIPQAGEHRHPAKDAALAASSQKR